MPLGVDESEKGQRMVRMDGLADGRDAFCVADSDQEAEVDIDGIDGPRSEEVKDHVRGVVFDPIKITWNINSFIAVDRVTPKWLVSRISAITTQIVGFCRTTMDPNYYTADIPQVGFNYLLIL